MGTEQIIDGLVTNVDSKVNPDEWSLNKNGQDLLNIMLERPRTGTYVSNIQSTDTITEVKSNSLEHSTRILERLKLLLGDTVVNNSNLALHCLVHDLTERQQNTDSNQIEYRFQEYLDLLEASVTPEQFNEIIQMGYCFDVLEALGEILISNEDFRKLSLDGSKDPILDEDFHQIEARKTKAKVLILDAIDKLNFDTTIKTSITALIAKESLNVSESLELQIKLLGEIATITTNNNSPLGLYSIYIYTANILDNLSIPKIDKSSNAEIKLSRSNYFDVIEVSTFLLNWLDILNTKPSVTLIKQLKTIVSLYDATLLEDKFKQTTGLPEMNVKTVIFNIMNAASSLNIKNNQGLDDRLNSILDYLNRLFANDAHTIFGRVKGAASILGKGVKYFDAYDKYVKSQNSDVQPMSEEWWEIVIPVLSDMFAISIEIDPEDSSTNGVTDKFSNLRAALNNMHDKAKALASFDLFLQKHGLNISQRDPRGMLEAMPEVKTVANKLSWIPGIFDISLKKRFEVLETDATKLVKEMVEIQFHIKNGIHELNSSPAAHLIYKSKDGLNTEEKIAIAAILAEVQKKLQAEIGHHRNA